jgi:hypothetical protein
MRPRLPDSTITFEEFLQISSLTPFGGLNIYTCMTKSLKIPKGSLYIHMMMSGDGYREHDQFWVTNDGDNIESNSIILINQRCYSMRHLLLNKS